MIGQLYSTREDENPFVEGKVRLTHALQEVRAIKSKLVFSTDFCGTVTINDAHYGFEALDWMEQYNIHRAETYSVLTELWTEVIRKRLARAAEKETTRRA